MLVVPGVMGVTIVPFLFGIVVIQNIDHISFAFETPKEIIMGVTRTLSFLFGIVVIRFGS